MKRGRHNLEECATIKRYFQLEMVLYFRSDYRKRRYWNVDFVVSRK